MSQQSEQPGVKPVTTVEKHRVQQLVTNTRKNPLDAMETTPRKKAHDPKLIDWTAKHVAASVLLIESKVKIPSPLYAYIRRKAVGAKHLTAYQKKNSALVFLVVHEEDYTDDKGQLVKGVIKYLASDTVEYLCGVKEGIRDFVEAARTKAKESVATPVKKSAASTRTPPPAPKKPSVQPRPHGDDGASKKALFKKSSEPAPKQAPKQAPKPKSRPKSVDVAVKTEKPTTAKAFKLTTIESDQLTFERLDKLFGSGEPLGRQHCGEDVDAIVHERTTPDEIVAILNDAVSHAEKGATVNLFTQPIQMAKVPPKKRASAITAPASTAAAKATAEKKRKAVGADPGPSNVKRRRVD